MAAGGQGFRTNAQKDLLTASGCGYRRDKANLEVMTHVEHGFGPVWDGSSKVLILGTMPSTKSRKAGFYYMFPRNRFWPVLAALFHTPVPRPDPATRRRYALDHRIALWDVLAECDIKGTSDSSIINPVPNDIGLIIRSAPIRHVFTTGRKAGELYRRLCLPLLDRSGLTVPMTCLPSTSTANAAKHLDDLVLDYRPILDALNRQGQ